MWRSPAREMEMSCRPGKSNADRRYDGPVSSVVGPAATPVTFVDADLAAVSFNAEGLVPAIVQEEGTGAVLMLAWMNEESLRRTLETGRTWFWSRSRQEYWCKGETSGDRQFVRQAYYDCDGDTLLLVVEQEGRGACHTGERTCFYRRFGDAAPE
ncbi:MAG: phosphoribosyl-AMP cyclohydrolase [Actinomycetota bacterium]|nr:phosphoribosyl-AMP cyclohydrolase [Actinomycetota bacterium]